MIIDFHTHIFPDKIAERALKSLSDNSGAYKPFLNGTLSDLLLSMKENKIDKSVIANIATKPEQFLSILEWSKIIRNENIIPLISIHPASCKAEEELKLIKDSGFKGIKLHPMYQNFAIDNKAFFKVYETCSYLNLFILLHAGYDIAFPLNDNASPVRIKNIITEFPKLKLIAAHLGGWHDWERVYELLAGENLWLETSFIHECDSPICQKILKKHNPEQVLFGTDSPWLNQKDQIEFIEQLSISQDYKERILYRNALELLRS